MSRWLTRCLFVCTIAGAVVAAELAAAELAAADAAEATAATALPAVPAEQHVIHGTFHGKPFWMRLQAPNKQFGDNRVCELVYTPPSVADLKGVHISDCPFLLIDSAARIVAWNGRDIGTKAVPAAPDGYAVTQEQLAGEGEDRTINLINLTIPGSIGWDLHIAPVLLALTWKADTAATIRLVDLFGGRHAEALTLTWTGTAVTLAGTPYTIIPDNNGRLAALHAADSTKLLTITGRE